VGREKEEEATSRETSTHWPVVGGVCLGGSFATEAECSEEGRFSFDVLRFYIVLPFRSWSSRFRIQLLLEADFVVDCSCEQCLVI
jgi:hypothetical protein